VARQLFTGTPPFLLSYLRNDRRSRIKPLMRPRWASQGRAMKRVSATGGPPDLNLSAFKFSVADTANPLIIERIPFPKWILHPQDRQSIIEFDMSNHGVTRFCASCSNKQSGPRMIV
jgi:hypothetical protein